MKKIILRSTIPTKSASALMDVQNTDRIYTYLDDRGDYLIAKYHHPDKWIWTTCSAAPHIISPSFSTLYDLLYGALRRGKDVYEFENVFEFAHNVGDSTK